MKVDGRRPPRPPREVPRAAEEERRGFDALVAALARPEAPARPEPRGEVRRGHAECMRAERLEEGEMEREPREGEARAGDSRGTERTRDASSAVRPREDVARRSDELRVDARRAGARETSAPRDRQRLGEEPTPRARTKAIGGVEGLEEPEGTQAREPETMPETMPPEIAEFVRFASDAPAALGPPPLPWSKAGAPWKGAGGEGSPASTATSTAASMPGSMPGSMPASTAATTAASMPASMPALGEVPAELERDLPDDPGRRIRLAWRPPSVREPVSPKSGVAVGEPAKGGASSPHVDVPANASSAASWVNALDASEWSGTARRSDEAWIASALAAAEERRVAKVAPEPSAATQVVLGELTPSFVRGVAAALDAASPQPELGEALARAGSRLVHEDSTIRLSHPELGRVRLHLSLDTEALEVRAVTESALAARLLAESEEALRRDVARHGVTLRRLKVQLEGESETPTRRPPSGEEPRKDPVTSTTRPPRRDRG